MRDGEKERGREGRIEWVSVSEGEGWGERVRVCVRDSEKWSERMRER